MVGNFVFTLYEVFGYLLPGGVTLLSFFLLYWAAFVPKLPLNTAAFHLGPGMWAAIGIASYVLGHAVQAVGNRLLRNVEKNALEMGGAGWTRECAFQAAAQLLDIPADHLESRWVYRVLDEYAVQTEQAGGDRDMFIYREGFYRATCIALFFLSIALLVRLAVPGASIQFSKWLFLVSFWQMLATAIITAGLGWLFFQRYKRFTEYRVTRAALSALVLMKLSAEKGNSTPTSQK